MLTDNKLSEIIHFWLTHPGTTIGETYNYFSWLRVGDDAMPPEELRKLQKKFLKKTSSIFDDKYESPIGSNPFMEEF